ncbi:uncharacterized protein [Nicotiana sylvestris]|uniref:uncharacterized protein n=1 Tax=Nicotiana sylvestris TaxID=4096 RepID=UPI00388C5811
MPGLSTDLVVHKLPIDPAFPPVKQKMRKFKTDMSVKIKEEVTKQFDAKVIRVTRYPTWLANVVPVPKKDGKTRVSVGYHDLNKASPKDNFPLPNIHILINNCAKHEIGLLWNAMRDSDKSQSLADRLAENPVDEEYGPLRTYFPDEEVMYIDEVEQVEKPGWKLFFDGAANMKGVEIGAVLISETGHHYPVTAQLQFRHIPRIHNEVVDALATLVSMLYHPDKAYVDPLHIQVRDQHAYCNVVEEELDGEPWFYDIREYLRMGTYPVQATGDQKRTIRFLASGFFLSGGVLYKRTPNLGLLMCIDAKQATIIMTGIHFGVCGPHMSGYVLAKKILRASYYWLTMERDCISFVRKCHQYQVHVDLIHSPPSELHTMSAPWPFVSWGIVAIGPIEPAASNEHRFILVAIDYFTKWVEAKTFKFVTKKSTDERGMSIVQDYASQFHHIPPQCEWSNRGSQQEHKEDTGKMMQGSKQWHEKLPFAILTTVCTSIGATPYLLMVDESRVSDAGSSKSLPIIVDSNTNTIDTQDSKKRKAMQPRSDVWNYFDKFEVNGVGKARCRYCKQAHATNSSKNGTT